MSHFNGLNLNNNQESNALRYLDQLMEQSSSRHSTDDDRISLAAATVASSIHRFLEDEIDGEEYLGEPNMSFGSFIEPNIKLRKLEQVYNQLKILLHSQRQEVRSRFNDWKSSESSESSPEILKNPEPASLNLKSKPLLDLAKSCTKKPQSNHKRVAFELDQWNGLIDSLNKQRDLIVPKRLHVHNIPFSYTEQNLVEMFKDYGEIRDVQVIREKNGNSKGYGFVTLSDSRKADSCKIELGGHYKDGRKIVINDATPPKYQPKNLAAAIAKINLNGNGNK